MARQRTRAPRMAARSHHHHRLAAGGGARRGQELARVAHALEIQQDRAGVAVGGEPVQQVAEIDVDGVAQRDHRGKAQPARARPLDHRRADRARLRHQGQVALRRPVRGEAREQLRVRRDHAQAVRPHHAQPALARDRLQRLVVRTGAFAHVAGQHDHRARSGIGGAHRHPRHRGRRRRHQHQLGHEAERVQARRGRHALEFGIALVDHADAAAKAAVDDLPQHQPAQRAFARTPAHQRHRGRREHGSERVGTHSWTAGLGGTRRYHRSRGGLPPGHRGDKPAMRATASGTQHPGACTRP